VGVATVVGVVGENNEGISSMFSRLWGCDCVVGGGELMAV